MAFHTDLTLDSINAAHVARARSTMLSPHISLWDLAHTHRADDPRLDRANWVHADYYGDNLRRLATNLLQPIRDHWSKDVVVLSGLRWAQFDPQLGQWEGLDYQARSIYAKKSYKPHSAHTRGLAADIVVPGVDNRQLWEWIKHHSPCPWGQLIYEMGDRHSWVHVELPSIDPVTKKLIYGAVLDVRVDSMGRARYHRVASYGKSNLDRWGTQQLEFSIASQCGPHTGAQLV